MSDVQPKGIDVEIAGQVWYLYMSIAAADIIQDHYDLPLQQVMDQLFDERERYDTCVYLLTVLMADEVRREGLERQVPTADQLKDLLDVPSVNKLTGIILVSYGLSMPQADEDDDPNAERSPRN